MSSEGRKNAIAFAVFLLLGGVLAFGAWRLTGSEILIRDCSFEKDEWIKGHRIERDADRYDVMEPMAEDLVKCDDLVYGKSGSEVRDLLGPPDLSFNADRSWKYEIGIPPPRSNYPGLVLEYGRDRAVASAAIPGFYER